MPDFFDYFTYFRFDYWEAADRGLGSPGHRDGLYVYSKLPEASPVPAGPFATFAEVVDYLIPIWHGFCAAVREG